MTKPKFLELSDDILYGDESHVESQPPSALGLDSLLPRLNWIGSMSEPTRGEDGRELSTAEIYERNQVRNYPLEASQPLTQSSRDYWMSPFQMCL